MSSISAHYNWVINKCLLVFKYENHIFEKCLLVLALSIILNSMFTCLSITIIIVCTVICRNMDFSIILTQTVMGWTNEAVPYINPHPPS